MWRQKALVGDTDAVRLLAQNTLKPLYRFCLYRVGCNHDLCEEVVQETMLYALEHLERYDPDRAAGNIYPWLTGLARNEIHRILNREKLAISLEALWAKMDTELKHLFEQLEAEPLAEDVLELQETRDMVNVTMSQLPAHYRDALEAKYVEGQSVRDMASQFRLSEKAVESQLTRARQAFRMAFSTLVHNLDSGLIT